VEATAVALTLHLLTTLARRAPLKSLMVTHVDYREVLFNLVLVKVLIEIILSIHAARIFLSRRLLPRRRFHRHQLLMNLRRLRSPREIVREMGGQHVMDFSRLSFENVIFPRLEDAGNGCAHPLADEEKRG